MFLERATSDIAGATSTLQKNADGVELILDTTELTPGDAYTVCWVVFNCQNVTSI